MKVAEAAKVIENSQRDINIAFVNELSKIFTKMGIDTQDVLKQLLPNGISCHLSLGWLEAIALELIRIIWLNVHNVTVIILR